MIKIKELLYEKKNKLRSSKLTLEFSNVHPKITNTLRRVCHEYLPTYCFADELMIIDDVKNRSNYDNDTMMLRMSVFPIPNIKNDVDYLPIEFWHDVDFLDVDRPIFELDNKNIIMYINSTNNTNDILNVTTNMVDVMINGRSVKIYDEEYPLLIIKLRPNETFSAKCTAVLSIGKHDSRFSQCLCYHEYDDDPSIIRFNIESNGQQDEYTILKKGCKIIVGKFLYLKQLFHANEATENTSMVKIVIENEDHTVGVIFEHYLQLHKHSEYAAVIKPNANEDIIVMTLKTDGYNYLTLIDEVIQQIQDLYNNI